MALKLFLVPNIKKCSGAIQIIRDNFGTFLTRPLSLECHVFFLMATQRLREALIRPCFPGIAEVEPKKYIYLTIAESQESSFKESSGVQNHSERWFNIFGFGKLSANHRIQFGMLLGSKENWKLYLLTWSLWQSINFRHKSLVFFKLSIKMHSYNECFI